MNSLRFEYLTEQYIASDLSEAEAQELWELIQADTDRARYLLQHLEWDVVLRDVCQSEDYVRQLVLAELGRENITLPQAVDPIASTPKSSHSSRRKRYFLIACSLLVLLSFTSIAIAFSLFRTKTPDAYSVAALAFEKKKKENTNLNPHGGPLLATIRVSAFVEWAGDTELRANPGDRIGAGWIRITSGTLALLLDSGPSLVIDGPAEFQLIDADRAFCSSGQVFAEVPKQAIGFCIDVPQSKVIDRGTAFGINVQDNRTQVHVISGEVELQNEEVDSKTLKQRESVVLKADGKIDSQQVRSVMMINSDPSTLPVKTVEQAYWEAQKERINRDPSVLIHFDFDENNVSTDQVLNLSHAYQETIQYGKILGCTVTPGRIDNTSSLGMEHQTDALQFDFPVEADALSLALWTRIDQLPRTYNSLFTTDGFRAGEFHWHILYDGRMELGVNFDESKPCIQLLTDPLLLPWLGQWVHLAVVLDRANKDARMYLNGKKMFHDNHFDFPIPFHFTNAQLGNWTFDASWNPVHLVRHFVGAIGDTVIFNRALSSEEVQALCEGSYGVF